MFIELDIFLYEKYPGVYTEIIGTGILEVNFKNNGNYLFPSFSYGNMLHIKYNNHGIDIKN